MKKRIMRFSLLTILLFLACLLNSPSKIALAESYPIPLSTKKAIIWDLGGVLFHPKTFAIAYHEIGIPKIVQYMLLDQQSPKQIKLRAFEVLTHLGRQPRDNNEYIAYTDDGLELPQIMCDWLMGTQDYTTILVKIYAAIDELEKRNFFVSKREKKLLKKTITAMFMPETLAKYMAPHKKACPLLKTINQCTNCQQYIISNWDPYSFKYLYNSHDGQKIFKHFKPENILISGACGFMKPQSEIFIRLLQEHHLNPHLCIFIDDQLENIRTAQACGLQTIWFHKMSIEELHQQLDRKGFLK